ncbi:MAG: SpoIID/LytB domain-containing protein [Actinomycetales bacterium]
MRPILSVVAGLALAASTLTFGPSAGPAAAAAVSEVITPDGTGAITLAGQGWGHGVGMSQYGAKKGAELGNSATDILAAYYPGAALTDAPTRPVRVQLRRWDGATSCTSTATNLGPCLQVLAEPGQRFTDVASGASVAAPTSIDGQPVASLAVANSGGRLTLWAWAGTAWRQVTTSTYTGPIDISSGDGVQTARIQGGDHAYRGTIRAVATGTSSIQRVNVVAMEDYLLGVVPSEMPASWATAAVQAQAVAARSYAAAEMARSGSRSYDLCDTTACQVYGGVAGEYSSATDKIRSASPSDVRGKVLSGPTGVITAFFGSSNGGYSVSGGSSWLPARADAWDPASSWVRTVTGSCLAGKYPGRGSFRQLVITGRDGNGSRGGRVTSLRVEFTSGSVTIGPASTAMGTDAAIRASMLGCGDSAGMRSSLFWDANSSAPPGPGPDPVPTPEPGTLAAGANIGSGEALESANGQHRLVVDPVAAGLARPGLAVSGRTCPDATLVAATNSGGTLSMQTDGNLVFYQGGGAALWSTGTWGNPGARAHLADDGELLVLGPTGARLWGSAARCAEAVSYELGMMYGVTRSPQPPMLAPGDRMASADAGTVLVMQTDGNLVLYRAGAALWQSRTAGRPGAFAVLQDDGNLVLYSPTGQPLFSTGTVWPSNHSTETDETHLSVGAGRLSVTRVVRALDSGVAVWTTTGWTS